MKAYLVIFSCIFFFRVLPAAGSTAGNVNQEEGFFKANQAYKAGSYPEAAEGYRRIIEASGPNGHLYYNLANAYLRLDDIGRAILFYEKARQHIPRDADLNFNLSYAHDQTRDSLSVSRDFLSSTFFWLDELTLTEVFWAFVVVNGLFFSILSVRLISKAEWTYYLLFALIFLEITSLSSLCLKNYQIQTDSRAVILTKEADIFAGPDSLDTVLFQLHAGTMVRYERSEGGWSLVGLSNDKRGWIKSGDIACILCPMSHSRPEGDGGIFP
ncbi:MAG: hypothetical protein Q8P24_14325 [Desulfobacterales bacterium]|nr:hypothetical protein [Desulfobacterales bacterium]